MTSTYCCRTCGAGGDGHPAACPNCGAATLNVNIRVHDTAKLSISDEIGSFGIRGGPKVKSGPGKQARWRREMNAKPGKCHKSNRKAWRVSDVERVVKTITEKVTDYESGEVIVDKVESLPDHQGHGSAKRKFGRNTDK